MLGAAAASVSVTAQWGESQRVEWGEAESVIIYPVTGHLDNHEAAAAGAQYSVPSLGGDKVT